MFSPEKVKEYLFTENAALKEEFVKAGLYIMAYEAFKNNIINKVKDFYWEGFNKGKQLYSDEYKRNYEGKKCFEKSCKWFVKMNVLSADELQLIEVLTVLRNEITHRFLEKIFDDKFEGVIKEYITIMINLNYKIDNWWIKEIEMSVNPEAFPKDAIIEGAASIPTYLLSYIFEKFFKSDENKNYSKVE